MARALGSEAPEEEIVVIGMMAKMVVVDQALGIAHECDWR